MAKEMWSLTRAQGRCPGGGCTWILYMTAWSTDAVGCPLFHMAPILLKHWTISSIFIVILSYCDINFNIAHCCSTRTLEICWKFKRHEHKPDSNHEYILHDPHRVKTTEGSASKCYWQDRENKLNEFPGKLVGSGTSISNQISNILIQTLFVWIPFKPGVCPFLPLSQDHFLQQSESHNKTTWVSKWSQVSLHRSLLWQRSLWREGGSYRDGQG